jgi:uncharacterized protein
MFHRSLEISKTQSSLLFGARGTGKSTLLQHQFSADRCLWLDLLDPMLEDQLARDPRELFSMVQALEPQQTYVIIDEVQKVPKLLDVVHALIEQTDKRFILTGSSARKLKLGGANLLAGRAFVYHLWPLSFIELGQRFDLTQVLNFGALPKLFSLENDQERLQYLQSYALTYLKEEIWAEQFVRKLDPFRRFLEVAAQSNGKIINFTEISRDVGVDDKTIKNYYSILEDTLIGSFLEPFHHSFRKRLSHKPKFYFFDRGIVKALTRTLSVPLMPGTSAYGEAFEHFIFLECQKLANLYQPEFRFSYLKTKDDAEIDLIVERPNARLLCIEIKSSTSVSEDKLQRFSQLTRELGHCEAVCLSQDPFPKRYGHVQVLPWHMGIKQFFTINS